MLVYLMAAGCEPRQVVITDAVRQGQAGTSQIIDDCGAPKKAARPWLQFWSESRDTTSMSHKGFGLALKYCRLKPNASINVTVE